jgi:hypothetical protein
MVCLGVHHPSTRLPFVVGDGILEISQLAKVSKTSFLAIPRFERYIGLSGCPSSVNSTAFCCWRWHSRDQPTRRGVRNEFLGYYQGLRNTWFVWDVHHPSTRLPFVGWRWHSQISQLAEASETSFLAITKVREIHWFVWVSIIRQLDCLLFVGDGILEISQLAEASKTSFLANTKV